MARFAGCVCALLLSWSGAAAAQEPPDRSVDRSVDGPEQPASPGRPAPAAALEGPSAAAPKPTLILEDGYGGQIVAASLASIPLGLAAEKVKTGYGARTFLAVYAFGPPLVHAFHGRYGTAFGSLGLRVALPVVAAFIGAAATASPPSQETYLNSAFAGGALGLVLGMAGATVIDAVFLADQRFVEAPPAPAISFGPVVHQRGGGLQLALRF
jgi:hypothetical protein